MPDDPYAHPPGFSWPSGTEPGPDTAVYRFPDPTLPDIGPLTLVPADADVVLRLGPDGSAELVDVSDMPDGDETN